MNMAAAWKMWHGGNPKTDSAGKNYEWCSRVWRKEVGADGDEFERVARSLKDEGSTLAFSGLLTSWRSQATVSGDPLATVSGDPQRRYPVTPSNGIPRPRVDVSGDPREHADQDMHGACAPPSVVSDLPEGDTKSNADQHLPGSDKHLTGTDQQSIQQPPSTSKIPSTPPVQTPSQKSAQAFERAWATKPVNPSGQPQSKRNAKDAWLSAVHRHGLTKVEAATTSFITLESKRELPRHLATFLNSDEIEDYAEHATYMPDPDDQADFDRAYATYPDFKGKRVAESLNTHRDHYLRCIPRDSRIAFMLAVRDYANERISEDDDYTKRWASFVSGGWLFQPVQKYLDNLLTAAINGGLSGSSPFTTVHHDARKSLEGLSRYSTDEIDEILAVAAKLLDDSNYRTDKARVIAAQREARAVLRRFEERKAAYALLQPTADRAMLRYEDRLATYHYHLSAYERRLRDAQDIVDVMTINTTPEEEGALRYYRDELEKLKEQAPQAPTKPEAQPPNPTCNRCSMPFLVDHHGNYPICLCPLGIHVFGERENAEAEEELAKLAAAQANPPPPDDSPEVTEMTEMEAQDAALIHVRQRAAAYSNMSADELMASLTHFPKGDSGGTTGR